MRKYLGNGEKKLKMRKRKKIGKPTMYTPHIHDRYFSYDHVNWDFLLVIMSKWGLGKGG